MPLTPEDIEKVRTKQIANLLRLANSGKPLTRAQQVELEQFAAGGRAEGEASTAFAKDQDELGRRLDISRKTIGNCLRRFKTAVPPVPTTRADGRYDVAAWAAFLRAHNIARKAEGGESAPSTPDGAADASQGLETVVDWKKEKLRLECVRIQLENGKVEGQLVEAADMESQLGVMVSAFRTAANNLPGRASQKLIGLRDFHDIEEILQAEVAVMLRTLEACEFLIAQASGQNKPIGEKPITPPPQDSWDEVAGEEVPKARKTKRTAITHKALPTVKGKKAVKRGRAADRAPLKGSSRR